MCRPLDTYTGKAYNTELQRYDHAIDSSAVAEDELPEDDALQYAADDLAYDLDI